MTSSSLHLRRRRGVALIIVLAFVLLISGLTIALFSRTALNVQINAASGNLGRVDILAKSGLEVVIGDLKKEIEAGSTVSFGSVAGGDIPIYTPSSNKTAVVFSGTLDRTTLPNLLKKSTSGEAFYSGTNYSDVGPRRASVALTTGTSANQRSVPIKRWNAPLLMTRRTPTSTTDFSAVTAFTAPHWIFVTKGGDIGEKSPGVPFAVADLPNLKDPNSSHYVIGRFAYTVYDQGGVLDINVAGNLLTENSRKGRLHQANLSGLTDPANPASPLITDAAAFLAWRAKLTGSDGRDAVGSGGLFDPKRDFIEIRKDSSGSDQTFFTRQDLIAYAKKFNTQFPGDLKALQFLTTFSREKNAPSWVPSTPAGSSINYLGNADTASSINRNFANVRDSNGNLLIKQRFPLSRISLIAQKATDVQKYFGLTILSGDTWVYNHGKAGGIYTLEEVRVNGGGREPDFFELLKAAILEGSLGKKPGSSVASTPGSQSYSNAQNLDAQIFQIGANIIDQYDGDNYPTDIFCNMVSGGASNPLNRFFGIENLPYLARVFPLISSTGDPTSGEVGGWLQPELWNPHQSYHVGTVGPTKLRIQALGKAKTVIKEPSTAPVESPEIVYSPSLTFGSGAVAGQVEFSSSTDFRDPKRLTVSNASSPHSANQAPAAPSESARIGIHTGNAVGSPAAPANTVYEITPVGSLSFVLEYEKGGVWYPYSVWHGVNSVVNADQYYVKLDPRTDRFGVSIGSISETGFAYDSTIRPGASGGLSVTKFPSGAGFTITSGTSAQLGLLADNRPGSSVFYADADAVVRPADGFLGNGTDGSPMMMGSPTHSRRALVLNRPFRSVGELGYAFRDLPFKTLDFFSTASADAGLLDVFSIDDNEVVAGRFDPNTRNVAVLKAMLKGAGTVAGDSAVQLSDAQVDAVANAILNETRNSPLRNRSDLVARLGDVIGTALNTPNGDANAFNKTRREAVVRALAEASNTRTWNLMIDVIAQTGRFRKNAVSTGSDPLNSGFIVEGERRYWLHLALDRYTGEVIDQQLELVAE